jgi:8-oxo-dGTP pyrophosphatase MutT (NUDIX family)
MTEPTHPVWTGEGWADLPVAASGGEAVVVPNVAVIVFNAADPTLIVLQRRAKPGEAVFGRLEIPGGRWRAGETPEAAVTREVREETGLEVVTMETAISHVSPGGPIDIAVFRPAAVATGSGGAYPALQVLFSCVAEGVPRAQPGETSDARWWGIDEVRDALVDRPADFVWQSHAMLSAFFETGDD